MIDSLFLRKHLGLVENWITFFVKSILISDLLIWFLGRCHFNWRGPIYYGKLCLSEIIIIFILIFNERYSVSVFHGLILRFRDQWNICTILYWWMQIKLIYWSHIFILKRRFFVLFIFNFLFRYFFQLLYFLLNFLFLFKKTLNNFLTINFRFIFWTFWFFIAAMLINFDFLCFFKFRKNSIIWRISH